MGYENFFCLFFVTRLSHGVKLYHGYNLLRSYFYNDSLSSVFEKCRRESELRRKKFYNSFSSSRSKVSKEIVFTPKGSTRYPSSYSLASPSFQEPLNVKQLGPT